MALRDFLSRPKVEVVAERFFGIIFESQISAAADQMVFSKCSKLIVFRLVLDRGG